MKLLIKLSLTSLIAAAVLTGCGGSDSDDSTAPAASTAPTASTKPSVKPSVKPGPTRSLCDVLPKF